MIRVGLIGTGGISGVHLSFLRTRKDVEIAALCDIKPENLERRRKEFGGRPFGDFLEMLDAMKLDAVWLCTPPQVRREPLVLCAKRRIPVFCEKPVGHEEKFSAAVARELKRLKARVTIGYVFRALPSVADLRAAMADDAIYAVESFYGCPMGIERSCRPWFMSKKLSGGTLVDQATHNLDLLRCLFGEVRETCALASNPAGRKKLGYTIDEVIGVSLRFSSGIIATHLHSWVADRWRNEVVLSGRKRLYRLDLSRGTLAVEDGTETRTRRYDAGSMYAFEDARFLDVVRTGQWKRNLCDFGDGLQSLRLTLACERAATGGKRVRLQNVG